MEPAMIATAKSLFELTAADMMSRVAIILREWMPLRDAAEKLLQAGVHGAPVVDAGGRSVGVLSVSDLARWASRKDGRPPTLPRRCWHLERYRAAGGEESMLCTLPADTCSFQTPKHLPDGRTVQVCQEPNCVCLEWQMVEMDSLPAEDVRHYMTAEPVTVEPTAPIREVARRMLDAHVGRVVVIDSTGGPVGVVSVTDLVAAIAGDYEANGRSAT
jgi:predicted transcriptional regulator